MKLSQRFYKSRIAPLIKRRSRNNTLLEFYFSGRVPRFGNNPQKDGQDQVLIDAVNVWLDLKEKEQTK